MVQQQARAAHADPDSSSRRTGRGRRRGIHTSRWRPWPRGPAYRTAGTAASRHGAIVRGRRTPDLWHSTWTLA
ncbi:MAG: hypothetical protein ACRYHQ_09670 [Janthinobacterium lividum]